MKLTAKEVLNKHLKVLLENHKSDYVTLEEMKEQLECQADLNAMEKYKESMTGCIEFATWLRDNYSTNVEMGRDYPLPKGKWRKDFTKEIYSVETLYKKWIKNQSVANYGFQIGDSIVEVEASSEKEAMQILISDFWERIDEAERVELRGKI